MKNLKLKITLLLIVILSVSCNDSLDGSSVTIGQMQITILKPYADGMSLGKDTTIAGDCGVANYPIEISGDVSLYTVCQSDNTWSAPISGDGFSLGQTVTVNATLSNPSYTTQSPIVTRNFIKADLACDDPSNYTKIFANIDSADGNDTPYVICTSSQLSNIDLYPSKNYVVGRNIDFGFARFSPIRKPFTGTLDGQNFVFKNLNIVETADSAVGLFKVISGATVQNLKISDANVEGNIRVGILAGDWRGAGTIFNVEATGTVTGVQMAGGLIGLGNSSSNLDISYVNLDVDVTSNDYAGGLISYVFADSTNLSITDSSVYANVSGNKYVGGVVGRIWNTTTADITDVNHKGDINSVDQYVGGIVGEAYHGVNISSSNHVGNITVPRNSTNEDTNVGGLIGISRGPTVISDSYVVTNISMGGNYAGGLVGRFYGGSITNSYSRGSLNATDDYYNSVNRFVGGITGNVNTNSTLNNLHSHMTITSSAKYVGGLVGFFGGASSTIDNSYANGSLTAKTNFVGGLVGQFTGASLNNSSAKMNITISDPTPLSYIGGLVGYVNNTSTFDTLNFNGDISISNGTADYIGGGFGYVKANSINNIYTTGSISGGRSILGGVAGYLRAPINSAMSSMNITGSLKNIGGIAGLSLKQNISNVFFTGSLTGDGNVGGIAGWFIPNSTTITNAYSSGAIYKIAGSSSLNSSFGPIGGDVSALDISSSYYNSLVFDQGVGANITDHNGHGTSQTLQELKNQSTFVGFDFSNIWVIPTTEFTLPQDTLAYESPVFTWMTAPNYGFQIEATFSDDPINENDPTIIPGVVISDSLALEFGQDAIDEITSITQASNVTIGNLDITIEKPATNNELISGKMLVYGECGVAKNTIEISGAFSLRTICQDNNRWAAVIDSTDLAAGNHLLSVDLKDNLLGSGSGVVSKTLVKGSSACDATAAKTGTYGNTYLGANGSSTPYLICNKGQFANISLNPGANYELGQDIDFSGGTTNPIAVDFTGTLDGKGFEVKNYTIDKTTTTGVGLFKSAFNATIQDISFTNFNVDGYAQVGGVVGTWKGSGVISNVEISGVLNGIQYNGGMIGIANTNSALNISNLTTSVTIIGNDYTGGVIGSINTSTGSLTASDLTLNNNIISNGITGYVGGFVGQLVEPNTTITNITQTNSILSYGLNVGGLIGSMAGGTITNCNVQGNITIAKDGNDGFIGGVIGKSTGETTISTCSYSGTIHAGSDHVAGIIGYMNHGSITGSTSSGQIDIEDEQFNVPRQYVAGIIGKSEEDVDVLLNNLSSSMNINAKASSVGGIVGHIYGFGSTLRNSYATGNIQGQVQFVGGLGGFFMGDIMEDSYATGSVTVTSPTPFAYVGGLLGYSNSKQADHKRVYATGDISVTGGTADYVAGLVGFFRAGALEDSYATGNVTGDAIRNSSGGLIGIMRGDLKNSYATGNIECKGGNCGGLIGYLLNSDVTYSFSTGDVETYKSAGGLIGFVNIDGATNIVENNYATGVVSRHVAGSGDLSKFGPLIGEDYNGTTFSLTHNYYLNESANVTHNSLGSGIVTSIASLSTSYPNFDFNDVALDWMQPPSGFELTPGNVYSYPIPDWRGGGGGGATLFNISGTLSGLQYDEIKLTLNGAEEITLTSSDSTFSFSTQVLDGSSYSVQITQNPSSPSISCNISNNTGVASSDINNISVVCPEFTSIDLVALNSMATNSSQNLVVNGTLSDSSVIDVTSYSTFTQNPANTFSIVSGTLTASSDATADVTANFMSLSSTESVTSISGSSQLGIVGTISNVEANETLASIQILIQDATGNTVTTANNSVTISLESNPGSATLSGTLTKSAVNGIVTFNDLSLNKIGSGYTLKASSTGLTDVYSGSFDISAGEKSTIAYVVQPVGASTNTSMNSFSVEVLDAGGNRVTTTETVTISFNNDPSSGVGSLNGTLSQSTVNGLATFNDISIDFATAGYTLNASVTGLTSLSSNPFNIFASATKLVFLSQPSDTIENSTISSFQVALTDDFNTVITSSTEAITLNLSNDPSGNGVLGGTLTKNAVNGVVTFNDVSLNIATSGYQIGASSNGVVGATSNSFTILINSPSTITLSNPANSPSPITTPSFIVDGVVFGDTVNLYSNAACTGPSLGSVTASSNSVSIISNALVEGSYNIYANRINTLGIESSCSSSSASYTVLNAFSQVDDMSTFANWTNSTGDDQDWSINTGDTPSAGVGPSTGTYAYTEASAPVGAGNEFILESNTLDGSTHNLNFDFSWNKRGDNMGDLYLEASNDNGSTWSSVWSHIGLDVPSAGVDTWNSQNIDLCSLNYNSANVKLRFRAVMPTSGNVWNSDIAVDDLSFTGTGCSVAPASITFDTPLEGTSIANANQSSFPIGGTCSENGASIIVSGDVSASLVCSSNVWSTNLDLSSVGDGLVTINLTHINSSGGANGTATREFIKDATMIQIDSFDTLGNWSNSAADDHDWIINSGATPSNNVGPDAGVNSSSYIYTEASSPVASGEEFIIESNVLDGSVNNLRIEFNWNKRGNSMGNLYLEASTDGGSTWSSTLWSHLGADVATGGVSTWNFESIDICSAGITSANTMVRFRAQMPTTGTVWNSDIALDEISFTSTGCSSGTAASIALNTPVVGTLITNLNQNSFEIGGSCSDHGQNISFSGSVSGSTTCNLGSWSHTLDLSSLPDGNVIVISDHVSADGGPAGRDTTIFVKDANSTTIQIDEFDSFQNWLNVTNDDQDWVITNGNTTSNGVGPTSDYSGSGGYVYTEASAPVGAGDEFILESTTFDASAFNLALSFKWNKRGDNMGDLYLEYSVDNGSNWTSLWSHIGADIASNGTDIWNDSYVDICNAGINSANVKFRFRAVMPSSGNVWNSDIALDNIEFRTNGCN